MRVAVIHSEGKSNAGGGYSLQRAILDELCKSRGGHSFVFVDSNCLKRKALLSFLEYLRPQAKAKTGILPIDLREVDCAWYLGPRGLPLPIPYIATVWDLAHRNCPAFPEVSVADWDWESRERNYANLLPRATRILVGTEAGKKEIAHYYRIDEENICVAPFPVVNSYLSEAQGATDVAKKFNLRRPFFFYPAQFWPHKNHVNLLIGFKKFREDTSAVVDIVFTGSDKGNYAHVVHFAAALGLTEAVKFLGFVAAEDLHGLYRKALALVFPTFLGPDNLPPLEAFAAGCPVAASRLRGAEDQLEDAALLFNPADPSAIADALATIWRNETLRDRLIARGKEVAKKASTEAYVSKVNIMLDEIEAIRRCWGGSYPCR
jgi:glycosyltransferase involved in cell wall biosynthesis